MRCLVRLMAGFLITLSGAVTAQAQCESASNGTPTASSGSVTVSSAPAGAGTISSAAGSNSFRGRNRRTGNSAAFNGLPQVNNPFPTGMGSLQAFQAQQVMAQRLTAASAVRNRRSAARQQQLLEINAQRAYEAGLSAERTGRRHTALQRYERAANIAPGTLAGRYAAEAMARLSR